MMTWPSRTGWSGKIAGKLRSCVPQAAAVAALKTAARPIVAMMIEITGSPISGRSTSRSRMSATSAITTIVSASAAQNGRFVWTMKARQA